jgi:DNA polymerase-3 subunit alpha
MGLTIRPPHVNHAGVEFSVHWLEGQAILFMGLGQVRELTQSTIGRILRERPFRSLSDFLARVDPRQQEALTLIRVGALEGFGSQPDLLRRIENQGWRAGQLSLFPDEMLQPEDSPKQDDWSLSEKVAAQEAILGVSLAAHPLELIEREIKASGAMTTVEAASKIGKLVRVAGMRQTWRRSRTQKGDLIYFMSLEDLEGMLDVIIPGEVYQKYRGELSGPGPYLVEGMLDLNPNTSEPTVRATRFTRLKT